jgi:DNA-binding transcriptional ArsR family regulator
VTRWEVTKAVRASALPSPSRLIMLTLADAAEVGTAEIPPKFTPSLSVLSKETALDRRTVQRHLDALEKAGWIVRSRPDAKAQWHGERVRYRLDLPSGTVPPVVAEDHEGGGSETPGVAAESPKGGGTEPPLKTDHSNQDQITSDPPSSAKPPKPPKAEPYREDVERICKHLADAVIANGSPATITDAWRREARLLIDTERPFPVTVEGILALIDWCQKDAFWSANVRSIKTFRRQYDALRLKARSEYKTSRPSGHQPYRNPADASAYHGDL